MGEKEELKISENREADDYESKAHSIKKTVSPSIHNKLTNISPFSKEVLNHIGKGLVVIGGFAAVYFFGRLQEEKHSSKIIALKNDRINELINLCEEKDSFYKEMISDGLRHGSSKAARQMAYKKYFDKHS